MKPFPAPFILALSILSLSSGSAGIIYVDAQYNGNTTNAATGSATDWTIDVVATPNNNPPNDNLWGQRTTGPATPLFESDGWEINSLEASPTLITAVTGLLPSTTYRDLRIYFTGKESTTANSQWYIDASLNGVDFVTYGDDSTNSTPVDISNCGVGSPVSASPTADNRYYADLPNATTDASGKLRVWVRKGSGANNRSVYDGIAYGDPVLPVFGPVTIVKIADTAPGPFNGFNAPSLNNSGTLAFFNYRTGIVRSNGTTSTTIAGYDGTFSNYGEPTINTAGTVTYTGDFIDGGMGLFTGNGSTTTTVSNTNASPFSLFGAPVINATGTVGFYASAGGGKGLYIRNGASPVAAIALSGGTFTNFSDPAINAAGVMGFQAQLSGAGGNTGVYTSDGVTLTPIALSTGTTFRKFDMAISINDAGILAFSGSLKNFNEGVYTSDGVTLKTIGQTGSGSPYSSFSFTRPSINTDGLVGFRARLTAGGGDALFVGNGTETVKVVATGDALFGSTVTALMSSTTALNDSNQFAFQYTLATGFTGVALATIEVASPQTPFERWAAANQLAGDDALSLADPDDDGRSNLEEFAFDGVPKSGAADGNRRADFTADGGGVYFTLTLATRCGAVFLGSPPVATVDGITYTVLADDNLSGSDLSVIERTPIPTGLPALSGYQYHSFRLTTTAEQSPAAFLRVSVLKVP